MQNTPNTNPSSEDEKNKDEIVEQPDILGEKSANIEEVKPEMSQIDTPISSPQEIVTLENDAEDTATTEAEETEVELAYEMEKPMEETDGKLHHAFRNGIRWVVGVLIIFGLGLLAGIFLFYRPAVDESGKIIKQLQTDLSTADENIVKLENQASDLETEISSLQSLKDKNEELVAENQDKNLHLAILDARIDVANAQLALGEDDNAQARIILNRTSNTFNTIMELLELEQQGIINDLKQRLELVMEELDEDPYAAKSDLDVLEMKLLQLQDSLFND